MADHQDTKRNRRARSAKARCRVGGLSSGVGAILALGITPMATAPTVKADAFDAILDPIINSITSSLGDVAAGAAAVPELGTLSLGATEARAPAGRADAFQGLKKDWIKSSFGQHFDTLINSCSTWPIPPA